MKIKTNKSLAKRIKITATGKWMHSKVCKSHLLTNKSSAAKSRDRFGETLKPVDQKKYITLLPYAS